MGGLDDLTPDSEDGNSRGKSTHIKFWNPAVAADDIPEDGEERHRQEFYDAAKELRNMYSQNINVPVGMFMVAARDAEKEGDYEALFDLAVTIGPESEDQLKQELVDAIERSA
jgi:hypothetical protein